MKPTSSSALKASFSSDADLIFVTTGGRVKFFPYVQFYRNQRIHSLRKFTHISPKIIEILHFFSISTRNKTIGDEGITVDFE